MHMHISLSGCWQTTCRRLDNGISSTHTACTNEMLKHALNHRILYQSGTDNSDTESIIARIGNQLEEIFVVHTEFVTHAYASMFKAT